MSGWSSWSKLTNITDLTDLTSLVTEVASKAGETLKSVENSVDTAFGLPPTHQITPAKQPDSSAPNTASSSSSWLSSAFTSPEPAAAVPQVAPAVQQTAQPAVAKPIDISHSKRDAVASPVVAAAAPVPSKAEPVQPSSELSIGTDGMHDIQLLTDAMTQDTRQLEAADLPEPVNVQVDEPNVSPITDSTAPAEDRSMPTHIPDGDDEQRTHTDDDDTDDNDVQEAQTSDAVDIVTEDGSRHVDTNGDSLHAAPESATLPSQQAETITTSQHTEVQQKLVTAEQTIDKLAQLLKLRESQMSKSSTELNTAHSTADALRRKIESSDNRISQLLNQVDNEQKTVVELQAEREQWRRRQNDNETSAELITAKNEQIQAILKEGETLMQKQLSLETIIKSLRKQLKDKDNDMTDVRAELDGMRSRAVKAEAVVTEYEAMKQRMNDMSGTAQQYEQLKLLNDTLTGKQNESAQTIRQLQSEVHTLTQQNQQLAQQVNMAGTDNQARSEREAQLLANVHELQQQLAHIDDSAAEAVKVVQQQCAELRQKLQDSEARNDELVAGVSATTKPLLRQIEVLQHQVDVSGEAHRQEVAYMSKQSSEYKSNMAKLTAQLNELNNNKAKFQLQFDATTAQLAALQTEFSQLQSQHKSQQNALSDAQAQVGKLNDELTTVQRRCAEAEQLSESMKGKYDASVKDKAAAEAAFKQSITDLTQTRDRLLSDISTLQQQVRQQQQHSRAGSNGSINVEAPYLDRVSSHQSDASNHSNALTPGRHSNHASMSAQQHSWLTGLGGDGKSNNSGVVSGSTVDMLRSLVKQKDSELTLLRQQCKSAQSMRDSIQAELIQQTAAYNELEQRVNGEMNDVKKQLNELTVRHNTALELIGEKDDELDDLRSDMHHVKTVFRQQVDDMLKSVPNSPNKAPQQREDT